MIVEPHARHHPVKILKGKIGMPKQKVEVISVQPDPVLRA
jgi:hypothetical protein